MKKYNAKVTIEHKKYCGAVRAVKDGRWQTPWGTIIGNIFTNEFLNFNPKRDNHVLCYIMRCNDISCPAQKIIRAQAIARIKGFNNC